VTNLMNPAEHILLVCTAVKQPYSPRRECDEALEPIAHHCNAVEWLCSLDKSIMQHSSPMC
jgi:hypothetical protein